MQHCEFCGSALPINARFCGHCGRTPGSAVAGPTDISDSPTANLPPLNAPTVLSAQSQPAPGNEEQEEEERRRRAILLDLPFPGVAAGEGQPSVGNVPMVQGTPQMSGVPMVQGTPSSLSGVANASGLPQSAAPNASAFSQSGAPNATGLSQSTTPNASAFSQSAVPSAPPPVSPTGSSTPLPQTGVPQPPTQHHHHERHHRRPSGKLHTGRSGGSAPKWLLGSVPKWLLLAIIGLVVATGSAAAAIGLSHGRLLGIGGASSASSTHTGSTQSQHITGKSGTPGASSGPATCPNSATATASVAVTVNGHADFTFSGAIVGHMAVSQFSFYCGLVQGTHSLQYAMTGMGPVGSRTYSFLIDVVPYTGPGTYNSLTDVSVDCLSLPADACGSVLINHDWREKSGTLTILSDEKSGTLNFSLQGVTTTGDPAAGIPTIPGDGPVQMTGSWTLG